MQKIPVRLAKPGMTLAKPILRDNGLVLMAEGTELTEALLGRLPGMNIETVVVKGSPLNMEGMGGSSAYAKRAERLGHLFRKYGDDPFMMKLKSRLQQYFQLKAAAQAAEEQAEKEEMAKEKAARAEQEKQK